MTPADARSDSRRITAGARWLTGAAMSAILATQGLLGGWQYAALLFLPAAYFLAMGSRAWGWAAGYRAGSVTVARALVHHPVAASGPEPVGAWQWCEQHQAGRFDGPNPCDRLHQGDPSAKPNICGRHLRVHGPGEFGPLCRAWDDVRRAELDGGPQRRYLRWPNR